MTIPEASFRYLSALVKEDSGIVLSGDQRYLLETRLAGLLERCGGAWELLTQQLRNSVNGALRRQVVELMTTNETYFFRDETPFHALHQVVLPTLIAQRTQQRRLTIWSAGCATGQEPYSIAMLLADEFPRLAGWDISIIANDIASGVLDRARAGIYHKHETGRGLPPALLARHFTPVGSAWQLRENIRRTVEFQEFNLLQEWPGLPRCDVVFLRNVLIYFDEPCRDALLARVAQQLAPDGYLFLGGAESGLDLDAQFQRRLEDCAGCFQPRPPG